MTASDFKPLVCVWELTLACNLGCAHCGSAAGRARDGELTTTEALALVADLRDLGCRTISFSGGEPLLRPDWPDLAGAVTAAGMDVELMTNGIAIVDGNAAAIAEAGFRGVSISVDGPAPVHDELRNRPGAFESAMAGASALIDRGVPVGAVTQINRRNRSSLEELQGLIADQGFQGWMVQLTLPHGRAVTGPDDGRLFLRPEELPRLEETLLDLAGRCGDALLFQTADTIGYMSCHEPRLRVAGGHGPGKVRNMQKFWSGCQAGLQAVGITSDGTVRGCLSQPPHFDEGNIRARPLADIWHASEGFAYNRAFDPAQLEGGCAACAFGPICRAGCTNLAWAATGSTTQNPYCLRLLSDRES